MAESSLPKVVFLELDSLPKKLPLDLLAQSCHVEFYPYTLADQVLDRVKHATVIVVNKLELNASQLAKCPQLKMVAVSATGVSNIDTKYCQEQGIVVKNIVGYAKQTVAEHSLMMMLALQRNLCQYHQDVKQGKWASSPHFFYGKHEIIDLHGLNLGIIGSGDIGQNVAKLGRAFGMKPYFIARKQAISSAFNETDKIPFVEGIAKADVISIHCPLTAETKDLIAYQEFSLMKETAIIINTARGGIIHEGDLIAAIQQKLIKGVALDVVTDEPMSATHPLNRIAHLPNVLITPHCAWLSDDALNLLIDQLLKNINEFITHHHHNQTI